MRHQLRQRAGTGEDAVHRDQLAADLNACFLDGFAPRDGFFALAGAVEQTGHRLDLPAPAAAEHSRQAELFDQHHGVAIRVVEGEGDRRTAVDHLALDDFAPPAPEQAMPEAIDIDMKMAVISLCFFDDFDVTRGHFDGPLDFRYDYDISYFRYIETGRFEC